MWSSMWVPARPGDFIQEYLWEAWHAMVKQMPGKCQGFGPLLKQCIFVLLLRPPVILPSICIGENLLKSRSNHLLCTAVMKNCSTANYNSILQGKYQFPLLIWHSSQIAFFFPINPGAFVKGQMRADSLWAFLFLSNLPLNGIPHNTLLLSACRVELK